VSDIRRKGKVPVRPGEPPKDAELIEVQKADEKWSVYQLDDGTLLKFRAVVTEVWRIENEYDPEGNPIYAIKSQNIFSVSTPDELKRK